MMMSSAFADKPRPVALREVPLRTDASARSRCLQRIEAAQAGGDVDTLIAAVTVAAAVSLVDDDLPEATWYVVRGLRSMGRPSRWPADWTARWGLMDLACGVAQHWLSRGDGNEARRLQDLLRDGAFDAVRHACALTDPAQRQHLMARAAGLLDTLGDSADAQALRVQAGRIDHPASRAFMAATISRPSTDAVKPR